MIEIVLKDVKNNIETIVGKRVRFFRLAILDKVGNFVKSFVKKFDVLWKLVIMIIGENICLGVDVVVIEFVEFVLKKDGVFELIIVRAMKDVE